MQPIHYLLSFFSMFAQECFSGKPNVDLHHLARTGDYAAVNNYLWNDQSKIDVQDKDGATPLLTACRKGNLYVATTLLIYEADANKADNKGITPLMAAARYGDLVLVKRLALYANLLPKDKAHRTAYTHAYLTGNHEVAKFLQNEMGKCQLALS